jgi:hypothetical protein
MSKMSDYLEVQLRAHIFRTSSFTKPAALYVSLHTADPLDTGAGAEANYGSYARVQRDPLDANWTAASATDGNTDNVAAITFPTASSGSNVVTHFGIWDALAAGNLICHGALTTSPTISTGVTPIIAIGALDITFQ